MSLATIIYRHEDLFLFPKQHLVSVKALGHKGGGNCITPTLVSRSTSLAFTCMAGQSYKKPTCFPLLRYRVADDPSWSLQALLRGTDDVSVILLAKSLYVQYHRSTSWG